MLDPRHLELLEGYPDQLSEAELAEVRAAAEADGDVAELVAGVDELMDLRVPFDEDDPGEVELSEMGRKKLARALAARETTEAEPAAPAEALPPPSRPAPQLVDPPANSPPLWRWAAAAALLLGLGFLVRPGGPEPDLVPRGDLADLDVSLSIHGPGRLAAGDAQPLDRPVSFSVVASDAVHLALLETQAGRTALIWPTDGAQWLAPAGASTLQPAGKAAEYTAAAPGPAVYHLIAAPGPMLAPPSEVDPASPTALHPDAVPVASHAITWAAP